MTALLMLLLVSSESISTDFQLWKDFQWIARNKPSPCWPWILITENHFSTNHWSESPRWRGALHSSHDDMRWRWVEGYHIIIIIIIIIIKVC